MFIRPQKHPREREDLEILSRLVLLEIKEPTGNDKCELARLLIRYKGFPGASDIKNHLQHLLTKWGYQPEQLFAETQQLHRTKIYNSECQSKVKNVIIDGDYMP